MKTAKEILEAIYKVYNTQEELEEYGQEKPEFRRDFDSEDLRKQFIGIVLTSGNDNNSMKLLKDCIDKMPDEWVAEFIRTINGDNVEKVSESLNEGMWESPFKKEHISKIKKLFSKPITFKALNSDKGIKQYFNVIGDDKFWDDIAESAHETPDVDARQLVAKYLKAWMKRKKDFVKGSYDDEAAEQIATIIKDSKGIFENLNFSEKVMPQDVYEARTKYEEQIKETTWLIQRVSVYGTREQQEKAYKYVTNKLQECEAFLQNLYNKTIGE